MDGDRALDDKEKGESLPINRSTSNTENRGDTSSSLKDSKSNANNQEETVQVNKSQIESSSSSIEETTDAILIPGASDSRNVDFPEVKGAMREDDFTIFHCVSYLGASAIKHSKSEDEIQKIITFLNDQCGEKLITTSVSVPFESDGKVIVYEEETQTEIARFGIDQIIYFARGLSTGPHWACFAFTCSHGESLDLSIFQCHVFRCDIPEAVGRVFQSFARAFESSRLRVEGNLDKSPETRGYRTESMLEESIFEVTLELKEDDGKGNFNAVPRDKGFFKLRSCVPKQIVLTVQQIPDPTKELIVERCFGLLLSPGRHVRNSDMQLVETLSWTIGSNGQTKSYVITGQWDSCDPAFESLNHETAKESCVFLTVAVDLVIKGIQEPIRFALETKAKIYPPTERFWMIVRKQYYTQQFSLSLKRAEVAKAGSILYQVVNNTPLGEVDRGKMNFNLPLNFTSFIRSTSINSIDMDTPSKEDEDTDDDEPLQSGMGEISKHCTDEQLTAWSEILANWPANSTSKSKQLVSLVRIGIPDTIRGEIWLRISGCQDDTDMMDQYRKLLSKDCSNEDIIQRDISRTFPANDYFRELGGTGQELLYKISKGYAVYDTEVGYCQGISFIGAALLLQMPEEQAFCLLVKIMYNYEFRLLYRDGFDNLRLKLYQLDRLTEELIPELWTHFQELGVESHMYANQWFLTLFTAKFPLTFVFRVIDLFLLDGMKVLFQIALALLSAARKDLLMLDFEGVLKYFRVTLPKKYRNSESVSAFVKLVVQMKVKRLKRYEAEYLAIREQERNHVDPLVRLQMENKRLMEDMIRNEHIITTLVLSKANAEESLLTVEDELIRTKVSLKETDDFNQRLKEENNSVKEIFQREVKNYDDEAVKKSNIIKEYKKICSTLSSQLEEEQKQSRDRMSFFQSNLCETCSSFVATAMVIATNRQSNGEHGSEGGSPSSARSTPGSESFESQIQPLENELAKTKIALAEAECRNDDLNHRLIITQQELDACRLQQVSSASRIWKNLTFNKEGRRSTVSLEDSSIIGGTMTNSTQAIPLSTSTQSLSKK